MNHIACHRVSTRQCHLLKVNLAIHGIRMIFAHIVMPTGSTSGRTCHGIIDTIFKIHRPDTFKTLMCDDVIPKDIEVFLNHRTQIFAECLHVLNKVRVDIILQTTNAIVVLNETSTRSFLHDIQHMLTVTHTIKECG